MRRVISITNDDLLHNNWNKAIEQNTLFIKLYSKLQVDEFIFDESDIVLLDVDNLVHCLDKDLLKLKVFCLDKNLDELKGFKLLKRGVKAYDNAFISPYELKEAINSIKIDKIWIYPKLMSFIIQNSTIPRFTKNNEIIEKLSAKEFEVAKFVSEGLTNSEIAKELNITLRTVKAHISSSFVKLNLKDRVSLALLIKKQL